MVLQDRISSSGDVDGAAAPNGEVCVTAREPQVLLDAVSRAIIEQLQQDGRRPYARIA